MNTAATRFEIRETLVSSLEEIACDLLTSLHIEYKREQEQLSDALIRWLDFRLRFVDSKPRRVHLSSRFRISLPGEHEHALKAFTDLVEAGGDVNPYQGRGLVERHDTSGKDRRQRTDHLWSDWGILHFHLTSIPPAAGKYFAGRSSRLLFAAFTDTDVFFIDVRHHNEVNVFENGELVRTLLRECAFVAEKCRMDGVLVGEPPSSHEVRELRRAGVMAPVVVDGVAYLPPGGGITTASTSTRVSNGRVAIGRAVEMLATLISQPDGPFQSTGPGTDEREATPLAFTFRLTPEGLGIFDERSGKCWLLPRPSGGMSQNPLQRLHDLIVPQWLLEILYSSNGQGPTSAAPASVQS